MYIKSAEGRVRKGARNLNYHSPDVRNPLEPEFILDSRNLNFSSLMNSPEDSRRFLPTISHQLDKIKTENSEKISRKSPCINSIYQISKNRLKVSYYKSPKILDLNATILNKCNSHSISRSPTPPQRLIRDMNSSSKSRTMKINNKHDNPFQNEIIREKIPTGNMVSPDLNKIFKDKSFDQKKHLESLEFKSILKARKSRFIAFKHFLNFKKLVQKRNILFGSENDHKQGSHISRDKIVENENKNIQNMFFFPRKLSKNCNTRTSCTRESFNEIDLITDFRLNSENFVSTKS